MIAPHLSMILLVLCPAAWAWASGSSTTLVGEVFIKNSAPDELAHKVVTLAYRGILGREPDAGGLENYIQHLHDGQRNRGIVWLCSILLESAEFKSKNILPSSSKPLFGLSYLAERSGSTSRMADDKQLRDFDLPTQLHTGIEGCADAVSVEATRRLLIRASSMTGSTRETRGLIAKRAASLIAHTTGASFWSERTESARLWSLAAVLRGLERFTYSVLSLLRDLIDGMKRAASTGTPELSPTSIHVEQRLHLRAC